jgi:hypothetical protein
MAEKQGALALKPKFPNWVNGLHSTHHDRLDANMSYFLPNEEQIYVLINGILLILFITPVSASGYNASASNSLKITGAL